MYPGYWSVLGAEAGTVIVSAPWDDKIVMVLVQALEVTGPGSVQEMMILVKPEFARDMEGYVGLADEQLTIDGLPAVKHVFQSTQTSELGTYKGMGVLVLVRRGDTVVQLVAATEAKIWETQEATIDQIIASLVIY